MSCGSLGFGDVHHPEDVERLAAGVGDDLLVEVVVALALGGEHRVGPVGERQHGVAAGAGHLAGERRMVLELADELRHLGVGDVEDHHAAAAVADVGEAVLGIGGAVHDRPVEQVQLDVAVARGLRHLAGQPLVGSPPLAGFHRVAGVGKVEDHVDEAPEARRRWRTGGVAAAVVVEAMHAAHAAAVPLRQLLGIDRVLDVPDDDALLERVAPLGAVQERAACPPGR